MNDPIADAVKGINGMKVRQNSSSGLDIETPDPLIEPDDMVIVEPPCHANEPLKVPEGSTDRVPCLVCGEQFAA